MKREQEITARRLEEMKISVVNDLTQQQPKETSMVINTNHCRGELDTIQYVIDRCGFRETNQAGEGDILWYLYL
jgi:hypothetical protein